MAWNPTGNLRGPAGPAGGAGDVAALIHAATVKATPVDADELPLVDSGSSWGLKKFTWSNLKAALQTAFQSVFFHRGNILGTVTQSGGVPTGAIVQRGSNANGWFVRFADGTQICWILRQAAGGDVPAYGYTTMNDWTYPAAFASAGDVAINASYHGYGTGFFIVGISGIGAAATTGGMYICNARNVISTNGGYIYLVAFGRWF